MSSWTIILICLITSAFFSGMEIAFVTSNKLRVELERKQGKLSSMVIGWFTDQPDFFIATMLVGNNISLVIYGLQMAILLEPFLGKWIMQDTWILIIQTILATLIILLTAEFLPKTLFRLRPYRSLRFFSFILLTAYVLLYPITWIAVGISNIMLKSVFKSTGEDEEDSKVFGKVDLNHFFQQNLSSTEPNQLMDHEIKLFQNALDFSNVKLRECMIPRTEIAAVEVGEEMEIVKQLFIETGYSRLMVFQENIDQVIGYIQYIDLFVNPSDVGSIVRPITIVPESMPANKLLSVLLSDKRNAAVVVDEFGGTAGIVTTEDILEEIFGEIEDEHDTIDYVEVVMNDTEFRFSARLEIDYLNDKYNLNLPVAEEYETLAGLILVHHESIPRVNETIKIDGFSFKVLSSSNTRIDTVRLKIQPA